MGEMDESEDLREELKELRDVAQNLVARIGKLESYAAGYEEARKKLLESEKSLEESRVTLLKTAEDQLERLRALRISKERER